MHAATSTSPSRINAVVEEAASRAESTKATAACETMPDKLTKCCKSVTLERQKQGRTANTKIKSKSLCESVRKLGVPFKCLLTNSFFRPTPSLAEAGKSDLSTALKIVAVYVQKKVFLSRGSLAKLVAKAGSALKGNGGFRP
jgi:hypothetical protein